MLREIDTRFGTGVGYAYDSASRLTAKVYPDGSAVHYAYDGAGRTVASGPAPPEARDRGPAPTSHWIWFMSSR
jgi:YD repeat-containing protein